MNFITKYFKELNNSDFKEFFKYIGPGFIVTVGFIDPGNWATNIAAGSEYGYSLLWVVLVSTIMLIILQSNASKLGIVSSSCIAEATTKKFTKKKSVFILLTVYLAIIATVLAELLGGAIALNILFKIPIAVGTVIMAVGVLIMVFSNTYNKIEGIIIGMVSIIAFSFVFELVIVDLEPFKIIQNTLIPSIPKGSIIVIMGVLGAVVMPHNLFLHSEFIQSRKYNLKDDKELKKQIRFSKSDTLIAMSVGFVINCSMIILAAATFFKESIVVDSLDQASAMLIPLLGHTASGVFAIALLFAGLASSITAAMAGGVISAGMFSEKYNSNDRHTTVGILLVVIIAVLIIWMIQDPYMGLILSQVVLSIQLPITIITQIMLTSDVNIMNKYANSKKEKMLLWSTAIFVICLNVILLFSLLK